MHTSVSSMSRVVAIAAVLALSGSAFAAGQDGQTVFKDPTTGRFRAPTKDEAKQLDDAKAQQRATRAAERSAIAAPAAPAFVRHASGMVQATLDEDSVSYSLMTRNADGELVLQCVTGASTAQAALSTPATTDSKEHQHDVQ